MRAHGDDALEGVRALARCQREYLRALSIDGIPVVVSEVASWAGEETACGLGATLSGGRGRCTGPGDFGQKWANLC